MASLATARIQKELLQLKKQPPPGIDLVTSDSLDIVSVVLTVPDKEHSIYANERYLLEFHFSKDYPIDAPIVFFKKSDGYDGIPVHPHIYSNGHICLDLLYTAWSPVHTVHSICLSLQSMLTGNKLRERPPDDAMYIRHASANPKKTSWLFHDDRV